MSCQDMEFVPALDEEGDDEEPDENDTNHVKVRNVCKYQFLQTLIISCDFS